MFEWLDRTTDWLGNTLKPKGYTGALMDAGYLDWSDILGAAGRGLLDWGAQQSARADWRPLNAPTPVVDTGRSFDLAQAYLGNAVAQRAQLQQLESDKRMRDMFGSWTTGSTSPITSEAASQVPTHPAAQVPTHQVLRPLSSSPYGRILNAYDSSMDAANLGLDPRLPDPLHMEVGRRVHPSEVAAVTNGSTSAPVTGPALVTGPETGPVTGSNPFGSMSPGLRNYISAIGVNNPTAAMNILGKHLISQEAKDSDWVDVNIPGQGWTSILLTDDQAVSLQNNNIPIRKHQSPVSDSWVTKNFSYSVDGGPPTPFVGTMEGLQKLSKIDGVTIHRGPETVIDTGGTFGRQAGQNWLNRKSDLEADTISARGMVAELNQLKSILNTGLGTGTGAQWQTDALKLIQRFNPEFARDSVMSLETFESITLGIVAPMMKQLGANPTDKDLELQLRRFPGVTKSVDGNRFIIEIAMRAQERKLAEADFYRKFSGTLEAQREFENNPLAFTLKFDRALSDFMATSPLWNTPVPPPQGVQPTTNLPEEFIGTGE